MTSTIRQRFMRWVLLVGLIAAVPAIAHHSTAMYDYKNTMLLRGTVKEFRWSNPHMFIRVMVSDAPGNAVEWNVECGTPNINARHGWKRSDIKPGDQLTMEINPLRDGSHGATLKWVELSDGRKLWGPAEDIVAVPGPEAAGVPPPLPPAQ